MDFECIDALLDLPEFRVTNQVIRPHELELHLERRDTDLVCPRCQVLRSDPRWQSAVYPRFAHVGSSRHLAVASQAFSMLGL